MKRVIISALAFLGMISASHATVVHTMTLPSAPYISNVPDFFPTASTLNQGNQANTINTNLLDSVGGVYRSPFESTADYNTDGYYTSVQSAATAGFNLSGTSLSLIWGSPDPYNVLELFSGANGTGSVIATVLGSSINPANGLLAQYVTISGVGTFNSVELFNSPNQNAFEVSTLVATVPLPASLPMFGGALLALAGFGIGLKRWGVSNAKVVSAA